MEAPARHASGWGRLEVMGAVSGHGLVEPLPPALHRLLRRAVLDHAIAEHRRSHLPILHVGTPGARSWVHPVRSDEPTDHALRADIVAALVQRCEAGATPLAWLTRPGELAVEDADAAWLAAASQAYGEAGRQLVFVAVTRHGWLDPRSGLSRRWVRLRARS